jgi:UDP-N-acetylmuramate dehydrogenase
MKIEEHVPLSTLTTFKVGGPARYVVTCTDPSDLIKGIQFAREQNLPLIVLGGGSNVLSSDEPYEGVVLVMSTQGIVEKEIGGDLIDVSVSAGVEWDSFVSYATEKGMWGIENLAGIPGSTGATPVQNIGAYGMDVSHTITEVTVYDVSSETEHTLLASECEFGYRQSRFKKEPSLIITNVTFRLSRVGTPHTGYPDLQTAKAEGERLETPLDIAQAVRRIRSRKFPDLTLFGTAGSFFKNPILTQEQFTTLSKEYGAIPSFPHPDGVKVPLAFILDKALHLKGYKKGRTFLFGNQPLVIVAEPEATSIEIESLAQEIEKKVFDATNITIEREVTNIFSHEIKKI